MKREVKIGIFAVAMIGVAWAGIRFLKGFDIFGRNTVYYAAYDQIGGVQSASPVMMRSRISNRRSRARRLASSIDLGNLVIWA